MKENFVPMDWSSKSSSPPETRTSQVVLNLSTTASLPTIRYKVPASSGGSRPFSRMPNLNPGPFSSISRSLSSNQNLQPSNMALAGAEERSLTEISLFEAKSPDSEAGKPSARPRVTAGVLHLAKAMKVPGFGSSRITSFVDEHGHLSFRTADLFTESNEASSFMENETSANIPSLADPDCSTLADPFTENGDLIEPLSPVQSTRPSASASNPVVRTYVEHGSLSSVDAPSFSHESPMIALCSENNLLYPSPCYNSVEMFPDLLTMDVEPANAGMLSPVTPDSSEFWKTMATAPHLKTDDYGGGLLARPAEKVIEASGMSQDGALDAYSTVAEKVREDFSMDRPRHVPVSFDYPTKKMVNENIFSVASAAGATTDISSLPIEKTQLDISSAITGSQKISAETEMDRSPVAKDTLKVKSEETTHLLTDVSRFSRQELASLASPMDIEPEYFGACSPKKPEVPIVLQPLNTAPNNKNDDGDGPGAEQHRLVSGKVDQGFGISLCADPMEIDYSNEKENVERGNQDHVPEYS